MFHPADMFGRAHRPCYNSSQLLWAPLQSKRYAFAVVDRKGEHILATTDLDEERMRALWFQFRELNELSMPF